MLRQSSNNLYRSLIPLAVGTFVLGTDGFVLNGMLPLIARDLDVSVATAGQLTTMFAWTYAIASPIIAARPGPGTGAGYWAAVRRFSSSA
ncbi:hypothetical protein ACIHDR_15645 [Nocardia sp. NPDC052278]|uniref:hypothetical protein n=1 Tax=unclassified Nocardia TaxID=2637762 RepID=UPI0036CD9E77